MTNPFQRQRDYCHNCGGPLIRPIVLVAGYALAGQRFVLAIAAVTLASAEAVGNVARAVARLRP